MFLSYLFTKSASFKVEYGSAAYRILIYRAMPYQRQEMPRYIRSSLAIVILFICSNVQGGGGGGGLSYSFLI